MQHNTLQDKQMSHVAVLPRLLQRCMPRLCQAGHTWLDHQGHVCCGCLCTLMYCFFLQLVERLYRSKWTRLDGLGGLVLTPTRELALQIFEELVKVCGCRSSPIISQPAWDFCQWRVVAVLPACVS